jgi:hypothetical protein
LALCKGKIKEAVEFYKQSVSSKELSIEQFTTIFNEDRELLMILGVKPDDLSILLDYLLFNVG